MELIFNPLKSSLARARTHSNPFESESVGTFASARASDGVIELGHIPPDCRILASVVEAWPRLSSPLKSAILAIIEAVPAKEADR